MSRAPTIYISPSLCLHISVVSAFVLWHFRYAQSLLSRSDELTLDLCYYVEKLLRPEGPSLTREESFTWVLSSGSHNLFDGFKQTVLTN